MFEENRVVWSEGMFLRVQHFQQSNRWTERLVRSGLHHLHAYPWGFSELTINRELLGTGKFAISSARGIFADGTPFVMPGDADLPPALDLVPGTRNVLVTLALPAPQAGGFEIGGDRPDDATVRYRRTVYDVPDTNSDSFASASLEVGRLRLGYRLSTDPLAGFEVIPIARIVEVRSDLSVVLDEKFIAPCLSVAAEAPLRAYLTELQGLISHRAEALAARIADPSVRGTAEVADFLLLQTLNRNEPFVRHLLSQAAKVHPEDFYRTCVSIAGELSTFTTESKRATVFPDYRHDDLQSTFAAVFTDLRASLSAVLEQTAVAIPLADRRHGVKIAMINDRSLLLSATFVLAVRANMPPEILRRSLPNQIKIGPIEQIAQLVNVALPGIGAYPLPVAPRQLPFRSGTIYFELDAKNPLWKQCEASGALAMHLAGEFPEIELDLWAIKG